MTTVERSRKDHNPACPRFMIKWPGETFLPVLLTYIAKDRHLKRKRMASKSQSLPELFPSLGERLKGTTVTSISDKFPFFLLPGG